MKKLSKRLVNKIKRIWVWSKINKIPDSLKGELNEPTDPTTKKLILIFKNLLKESHTHLYKIQIDYDIIYEIHDNVNKICISLLYKSNCSEIHLMNFPIKGRSLSEFKTTINSNISERLIHSMLHEMEVRSLSLHESFQAIKKNNLEEISKTYEHDSE